MKISFLVIVALSLICTFSSSCASREQKTFSMGNRSFKKSDYKGAIQKYTEAIAKDPNDYRIYFNRSLAWKNINELDHAINDLSMVIHLAPKFAASYLERGIIWGIKGFKDLEISDYNKAIELNPKFVQAYHNRGVLKEEKEEFDSAFQEYCKAIEINPDYFPSLANRAGIYQKQKKYNKAILDYNKVLNINPEFAEGYFLRGKTYYEIGNLEKADQDLSKAIRLNPENDKAFLYRGNIWYSKCNFKKVIEDYTAAIKINSSDADVYNELAWIFATATDEIHRNGTKAVEYAKKAIELEPNFKNFDTLAAAYAESGRFGEAIKTQEKAISLCKEKNDPAIFAELSKHLKNYERKKPWRENCTRKMVKKLDQ